MPVLSAFTPTGFLELADEPSEAENIYDAILASLGDGNYDLEEGSREEAWAYAWAWTLAAARLTMIHAGLQIVPECVDEMMANREAEWQIVPGPFDSLADRRAVLAAREMLPRGARREAVEDALRTMLGASFLWYYTTKPADIEMWPATLGAQPQNLKSPITLRKRVTITQPISIGLGAPQTVSYAIGSDQPQLDVGDELVIEPEQIARTEVVTVTAIPGNTFTATSLEPHNWNCIATTMPFPMWSSNQRQNLVITSSAAARDPETRRKAKDLLGRILRGVSTWGIVEEVSSGVAGPFTLDVSPLDCTPIGTITYP